jgi:hypothetical protein
LGYTQRRDAVNVNEQQLQRGAIHDALGLQGRRDQLGLAEQNLQRGALSDARGIVDARNQLDLQESGLTGNLRGEATLQARQAQADQGFRAVNLQQDVSDRVLSRLSTQLNPTGREGFEEDVRRSRVQERFAGDANRRAGQTLESQLFGEVSQGASRGLR